MSFNNISYSFITKAVNVVQNPALPIGTLIEEIPCDIGRSYEGYKRGGVIEGTEKFRKEVMAAIVWLFGMPAFRFLGDKFFVFVLIIPMNIDYSNPKEGNDAIKNSVEFLKSNTESISNTDVSELKNVSSKIKDNLKKMSLDEAIKKISFAKKITSISALVLNCVLMGIVLPKFNQKLTKKKLEKMKSQPLHRFDDFETFKSKVSQDSRKKNDNLSFRGGFDKVFNDIKKYGLAGFVTYKVENDNVFRLCSTDIPMTAGRTLTSRTFFEGFENSFMDIASMFFYNFCASLIQNGFRKKFNIPNVNPANIEAIKSLSSDDIKFAIDNIFNIPSDSKEKLRFLFKNNSFVDELYKQATYGKYGKINRFVKNSDINSIDNEVIKFLMQAKEKCFENGSINLDKFNNFAKKVNKSNSKYLAFGLGASIFGLSVLVPKLTFWITRKLTGRNEFTGLADYSDLRNKKT